MFPESPVATVTTSRVISSCVFHFIDSMRVGESVGFILDLISLIIGLGINHNIVFVVFSTIWIIRIVLSPAKQGRSILGQLATNDKSTAGLNGLNW